MTTMVITGRHDLTSHTFLESEGRTHCLMRDDPSSLEKEGATEVDLYTADKD